MISGEGFWQGLEGEESVPYKRFSLRAIVFAAEAFTRSFRVFA